MKTLSTLDYARLEPEKTKTMMAGVDLSWIAYKVLAAGRRKEPIPGQNVAVAGRTRLRRPTVTSGDLVPPYLGVGGT